MCMRLHHSKSAFSPGCVFIAAGLLVVSPARGDWGLIGYWAMDENGGTVVNDTHDSYDPNNHDGTVFNAVWKSGRHGSALEFPKETESAMVTGIAQAFDDAADGTSLTVSAWVKWYGKKPNTSSSPYSYIFDARDYVNQRGFILYVQPTGYVRFQLSLAGGLYQSVTSFTKLPASGWTHVAAVLYYGSTPANRQLKIYINGKLRSVSTPAVAAYRDMRDNTAAIGNNRFGSSWAVFNGRIDEVKVWNRALSATEIYDEYTRIYFDCAVPDPHDWDENFVDDNCQPDWNENGYPDFCDLPDGCAIGATLPDGGCGNDPYCGQSLDCQPNGIPDECESDCNLNGIPDDCDISQNPSLDNNLDGVVDECEFQPGDVNCDGAVNAADVAPFTNAVIGQTPCPNCYLNKADTDGSGAVDALDIRPFIDRLLEVLPQ